MPLNFPSSPTANTTYSFNSKTWTFNGNAWELTYSTLNTNIVTEATNLYFTNARAIAAVVDTTLPVVLNDISNHFDGTKTVFPLLQDQTSISNIVDSKDLEVVINGARLTPYVKQLTYPWLVEYDSFRGFRVSSNNLIIYNAPFIGDSSSLIFRNVSTTVQTRKYPYSATTVALGD